MPRPGLAGFDAGLVPLHELFQPFDLGLLPFVQLPLMCNGFDFQLHRPRVVPQEHRDPGAFHIPRLARHRVEKVTVVGHDDDRLFRLGEERLQPFRRRGVQVVGRLVQNQNVRGGEQSTRQRHPHPLAAAQLTDDPGQVRVLKTEAERGAPQTGFRFVAARPFKPFRTSGVSGHRLFQQRRIGVGVLVGHQLLQAAHLRGQLVHVLQRVPQKRFDVAARIRLGESDLLSDVTDLDVSGFVPAAAVQRFLARQHAQQRTFAAAIGADDADLVARVDGHITCLSTCRAPKNLSAPLRRTSMLPPALSSPVQSVSHRPRGGRGPIVQLQLAEDVADVVANRLLA